MQSTKPKLYQMIVKYFIFLCLVSMALSLALYFVVTYRSIRSFASYNMIGMQEQQIQLMNNWIHERIWDIKELSFLTSHNGDDLTATQKLFSHYLEDEHAEFDHILFADEAGNIKIDDESFQDIQDINIKDRSYFLAAMEGRDYISEVIYSRMNGEPTIMVASPVYSSTGAIKGVVIGSLSLEELNKFTSMLSIGKTGETYLVDKRGVMLTESRFTPWLIKQGAVKETTKYNYRVKSKAVEQVTQGINGFGSYKGYRGKEVLGTYRWLPEYQWGILIEIDEEEVMGSLLSKIYLIIFAFCVLIVVLTLPLARYMAGRIVLPLTNLMQKVAGYADEYQTSGLTWIQLDNPVYREVDLLGQSFVQMNERIKQLMYSLEAEALYDPLTRLANRKHLMNRGREIVEQTKRSRNSCSLIFLDIDKFKKINDKYGHLVGDQVLVKLAAMINSNIRMNDVAARLGGEEFVIILPDTALAGAKKYAERLRAFVEETPIEDENTTLHITVSIGVASYTATDKRDKAMVILQELIHQADVAMYRAKELGRNRVEIF